MSVHVFPCTVGPFVCAACDIDDNCIDGAECLYGKCSCKPGKVFKDNKCGTYLFDVLRFGVQNCFAYNTRNVKKKKKSEN